MQNYKLVSHDRNDSYKELRVLVVDDFEAMVRTLSSTLEELGFEHVLKAKDGKEALQRLKNYEVDLIISDWNMPKMNGLELLKEIRSNPNTTHIPFVMVTGNLIQSDVIEAIENGVSEYLIKPFSTAALNARIHKAFVRPIPRNAIQRLKDKARQGQDPEEEQKLKILIVDDETNNLMVLGELLKEDYRVQAARSGMKAVEICRRDAKPDLILLDIMMPKMSGLEVCKTLKDDSTTAHIPIMFVSALSETSDVVKGLTLGAVDYITKPIVPEIVKARVKTHCNIVKQQYKLAKQIDKLIENARVHDEVNRIFQHDLRNPLAAIMTTLPSLKNKAQNCASELDTIEEASDIVLQMVNNQSLILELENNEYKPAAAPINTLALIKRVANGYMSLCQMQGNKVRIDIDLKHGYLGDNLLSYNTYSNLIKNAIEASSDGSIVMISSEVIDDRVIISIHNDNPVPINIQGRFFDKFVTNGKVNGAGIGAYSAKLCVEAQKGTIELVTSEQSGTTLKLSMIHRPINV